MPEMADKIRETFQTLVEVEQVQPDARVEAPLAVQDRAGPDPIPDATEMRWNPSNGRTPPSDPNLGIRYCRPEVPGAATVAVGVGTVASHRRPRTERHDRRACER